MHWCQYRNQTLVRSKELPNLNLSKYKPTLEITNSHSQQKKHNSTQKDQPLNLDYIMFQEDKLKSAEVKTIFQI